MSHTWRIAPAAVVVSGLVCAGAVPAYATDPAPPPAPTTTPPVSLPAEAPADADSGGVVGAEWGDDSTKEGRQATASTGSWDASVDLGSLYSLAESVGAHDVWERGVTGDGVTVAVVDTGVVKVPGLDGAGKVLDGPDLSFESQFAGTRYLDGFGHGTHLSGIIAGRDAGFDPANPDKAKFAGVAPGAELLNMKVATGDGGADVSQVVAAIDWVVAHREDNGMDVRVINLSYGTSSTQDWQVDPIAHAVENAWRNGILVVVSSGNDGLDASSLLMPAVDPHVLAVGAVDHRGTTGTGDDVTADFTNGGDATRHSDLLAPGKSVVSLRVPGSYSDRAHPEGLVAGDDSGRFFRGSGTSQAAAVMSGLAALLFEARPDLTPDQAKAVLMGTASPLAEQGTAQGAGAVDIDAAVTRVQDGSALPSAASTQPRSSGLGTLDAARGGEHVVDPSTGVVLTGEVDAQGAPWRPADRVAAVEAGTAWTGGTWNDRTWTGTRWVNGQYQVGDWTGTSWSGTSWDAQEWPHDQFQARSWRGNNWEARSWRADSWLARSWRNGGWVARSWRGMY